MGKRKQNHSLLDKQTLFAWVVFACQMNLNFPILDNLDSAKEFAHADDWILFDKIKDSLLNGKTEAFSLCWSERLDAESQIFASKLKVGEASGLMAEAILESVFLILITRKQSFAALDAQEENWKSALQKGSLQTVQADLQKWLLKGVNADECVLLAAAFSRSLMVAALCVGIDFYKEIKQNLTTEGSLLVGLFMHCQNIEGSTALH